MQLKTVEERVRTTEFFECAGGYAYLLRQDRADIRALLREGVEKTVCASEAWEGSYDPMEYQNGYARAKKDILTLIDTLLPGEVSN